MDLKAKLIVGFVWWIIIFQTSAYLYLYVPLEYQYDFVYFLLKTPIFIVVVSLLCVSYYRAIYSLPGHPSPHVVPDKQFKNLHFNDEIQEIKERSRKQSELKKLWRKNKRKGQINMAEIDSLNNISYCFKCDLVKEQRVHHCSICRKCIIRMDHHCPWVGNCVGKFNHKYFILFLFYATTGLLTVALSITWDYSTGQFYAKMLGKWEYYIYYFACITSYMLALSIGFLFVTQMMTACKNITTLQSFTDGITQKNPFTRLSIADNLRQIFGYSHWWIPTDPFPDNGGDSSGAISIVSL